MTRLGVADTVVDYRDSRALARGVVLFLEPGHVDLPEPVGVVGIQVDRQIRALLNR